MLSYEISAVISGVIKKDSEVPNYALIFEAEFILNLTLQLHAKKVLHLLNSFLPLHHGSHICNTFNNIHLARNLL